MNPPRILGSAFLLLALYAYVASKQANAANWDNVTIAAGITGAILLAGPTYLKLRREARDPNAAQARLTGTPRHGALAALAAAILGLIALDMPARTFHGSDADRPAIPVKELSLDETSATVAGLAAAVIAGYLILSQTPSARKPAAIALIALGAFLTFNALYACNHVSPELGQVELDAPALGAQLNFAAALALVAGAATALRTLISAGLAPAG